MKSVTQYFSHAILCLVLTFPIILSDPTTDNLTSVHNAVNIPFENLYLVPDVQLNTTAQTPIMSENCSLAFEKFTDSIVNFTRCTVTFARPIRVCMKCVDEYKASDAAYNELKKQASECQQYFFSSDQLGIVDIVYKSGTDIWKKSFCQNCFDNLNQTELFFQLTTDLESCIEHSNKSAFLSSNSTCQECRPIYANLSSTYHKFVLKRDEFDQTGGICMDVVDSMNISRRTWSQFKCSAIFENSIGFLNILTALTVGATPAMFYLLAKNVSSQEDVKLVRPKRKSVAFPVNRPEE